MYSSLRAPRRSQAHAEGFELLLQPADAQPQLDPSAGQPVEGRQLLGEHQRIALRDDQDAGAQLKRRRRGGDERQPDQGIGDRRIGFGRDLAVGGIGVLRRDRVGHHHMLAAPDGFETHRLRAPADLQRRVPVDTYAAREGQPDFHGENTQLFDFKRLIFWRVDVQTGSFVRAPSGHVVRASGTPGGRVELEFEGAGVP